MSDLSGWDAVLLMADGKERHSPTCESVPRMGQKGTPSAICTCDRGTRVRVRTASLIADALEIAVRAARQSPLGTATYEVVVISSERARAQVLRRLETT